MSNNNMSANTFDQTNSTYRGDNNNSTNQRQRSTSIKLTKQNKNSSHKNSQSIKFKERQSLIDQIIDEKISKVAKQLNKVVKEIGVRERNIS